MTNAHVKDLNSQVKKELKTIKNSQTVKERWSYWFAIYTHKRQAAFVTAVLMDRIIFLHRNYDSVLK